MFLLFVSFPEGFSLEKVRLATGAGMPVARRKEMFEVFVQRENVGNIIHPKNLPKIWPKKNAVSKGELIRTL